MKGDYYRYLAEVAVGERRKEIMDQSQAAYKGAFEVAQKEMPVSNIEKDSLKIKNMFTRSEFNSFLLKIFLSQLTQSDSD